MRLIQQRRLKIRTSSVEHRVRLKARQSRRGPGPAPGPQVELLFDSFGAAAFGVRSSTHPQRNLLYRAAPLELDLLIEKRRDANRLRVTGQLLDVSLPTPFCQDVMVTLWNFRKNVVTLQTNEWGEFLGEIEDCGELMVALKIQEREIIISIRNVLDWPVPDS